MEAAAAVETHYALGELKWFGDIADIYKANAAVTAADAAAAVAAAAAEAPARFPVRK